MSGQGADMPGSAVAAHELYLQGVRREQLDDGPHISRVDFGIVRAAKYGHHVQQFQWSSHGHVGQAYADE